MTALDIAKTDIMSPDIGMSHNRFEPSKRVSDAVRIPSCPIPLSRKQKAAIIVRLLLAEGAVLSLQDLPEALQTELIHQISVMRYIDRATLKAVVDEFVSEIEDIGLAFPNGIEGALTVLDGAISPATAARVRKLAGVNL